MGIEKVPVAPIWVRVYNYGLVSKPAGLTCRFIRGEPGPAITM